MARRFAVAEAGRPVADRMQWGAALKAGLLAGAVLLVVPRGSPWSSFTFFSLAIMGRALPPQLEMPMPAVWLLHLAVALVYGLTI